MVRARRGARKSVVVDIEYVKKQIARVMSSAPDSYVKIQMDPKNPGALKASTQLKVSNAYNNLNAEGEGSGEKRSLIYIGGGPNNAIAGLHHIVGSYNNLLRLGLDATSLANYLRQNQGRAGFYWNSLNELGLGASEAPKAEPRTVSKKVLKFKFADPLGCLYTIQMLLRNAAKVTPLDDPVNSRASNSVFVPKTNLAETEEKREAAKAAKRSPTNPGSIPYSASPRNVNIPGSVNSQGVFEMNSNSVEESFDDVVDRDGKLGFNSDFPVDDYVESTNSVEDTTTPNFDAVDNTAAGPSLDDLMGDDTVIDVGGGN